MKGREVDRAGPATANRTKQRMVAAIALATISVIAHAQSASIIGNVRFAVDTSGVHVSDVRLGGQYPFGAYMDRIGVPMQSRPTLAALVTHEAGATMGLWRQAGGETSGLDGQASFVEAGGRVHTLGDGAWRVHAGSDTTLALLTAGDLMSTDEGIARGIGYGFFGSSVVHAFPEDVTAEGQAGVQSFTDGNERLHVRAGLVWNVLPAYGVSVQWRWRQYESMKDDADAAYFNPDSYAQNQVAAGVRKQIGRWTLSAAVGAGMETINGSESRPIGTAELRGDAALTDKLHVAVYAGYDHSASYADAPDSAFRQIGVTLIHAF